MPMKLFKVSLTLLALIISPLILAAIASAVFVTIRLANGDSFPAAMQALTLLFENLLPILPYITGIPALFIIITAVVTNRNKIQAWLRNR
jgi:hypothetical protein